MCLIRCFRTRDIEGSKKEPEDRESFVPGRRQKAEVRFSQAKEKVLGHVLK